MPKPDPQEELFINFYEEVPGGDDDPEPSDEPDPEPGGDDPNEGDDPNDEPEPGDEGAEDEPDEGDKPKKKDPRDQPVPFSRFQKERNERKRLERELAEARGQKPAADDEPKDGDEPAGGEPDEGAEDEPELDERSQKALAKFLKDKGYKSQDEIDAEIQRQEAATAFRKQVEEDTNVLTAWAEENGYPSFNTVEVDKWADENLGKDFVKNRQTLKAAYMAMHEDAIREQDRKAALADATEGNAEGEKPGAGAKTTPANEQPTGRNKLRSMIRTARQEIDEGK